MIPDLRNCSIQARNVHAALPKALELLNSFGEKQNSRNGSVLVSPYPVNILYERPQERVVLWADRDANPFFHFCESLWLLAGRNDVAFPAYYAKQIKEYSDDGLTLWGAYGNRWRYWFGYDQLFRAVRQLKANPEDRRVVITMWDGQLDAQKVEQGGKDVPCNTQIYLSARRVLPDGKRVLDMQVCCRSNDAIWGALGANAVHFSMLQEYLAAGVGVSVGYYVQSAWNFHLYTDFYHKMMKRETSGNYSLRKALEGVPYDNPYAENGSVSPFPMVNGKWENWEIDLNNFLEEKGTYVDPFFIQVAEPIRAAYRSYKEAKYLDAHEHLARCAASDWRTACTEWIQRRKTDAIRAIDQA